MKIGSNTRYVFLYDATGPMTLRVYNGTAVTTYYYVRNLQGDIIAILNTAGKAVVEYTYDAWGNVLTITGEAKDTIGLQNPLLYRGYVYDRETKLYYLQSRYYDPEMGRFLNADAYAYTGQGFVGYNMFAYCINNPVLLKDDAGVFALAATIATVTVSLVDLAIAIVAVAAVALVDKLVDNIVSGQSTLTSQSNTYSKGSSSTKSSNSQASAASGGAAAPLPPNDPNKNKPSTSKVVAPASPKKVSDKYISQNNIDAHAFKKQAGKVPKSQLSKYDIYQDTANNNRLWVARKGGTDWRETIYLFIDLTESWVK